MYMQGWFPLGWTGWISLQSTGLTRVFSNTTVQSIILWCSVLFIVQLSHPYMTTGKTIALTAAAAAKSLQSCPTLCDPKDSSPPGSAVPGILQARTREWVAISFSNAWKWKVKVKSLSHVRPSVTSWTAAFQAPPSMGFSSGSGAPLTCCQHYNPNYILETRMVHSVCEHSPEAGEGV